MNRPRTFYGWVEGETVNGERVERYKVSVFSGAQRRPANTYNSKPEAERDAIKNRTDANGKPRIEWENDGSVS